MGKLRPRPEPGSSPDRREAVPVPLGCHTNEHSLVAETVQSLLRALGLEVRDPGARGQQVGLRACLLLTDRASCCVPMCPYMVGRDLLPCHEALVPSDQGPTL